MTWVNAQTKEKYKKRSEDTFPQIIFQVKTSNGKLEKVAIGGNDDLDHLIQVTQTLKSEYSPQIIVPLLQLMNCMR